MPRWWKKTPDTATEADVRFLMLLCLGLEPSQPGDIVSRTGQNPFAICKTLLRSALFRRALLEPLILGKAPCHVHFSTDQQNCIRRGLKRHFDLSAPNSSQIDHWAGALLAAIESPRFLRALNGAELVQSSDWLIGSLIRVSNAPAEIAGAIEGLSATSISGYACWTDGSNIPLVLDIYINEIHVGTCRANEARRDIQELHGGNGLCGFTLPIALPNGLADHHTLIVNVFEHGGGRAIARAKEMARVGPGNIHYIPRLIQALEKARDTEGDNSANVLAVVEELRQNLPSIRQFTAIPLASYADYFEHVRASIAPAQTDASPTTAIVSPDAILAGKSLPDADIYIIVSEGETLARHADLWIRTAATDNPNAAVFFADHDEVDARGYHRTPWFKAEFDYDVLLAQPKYAQAYAVRRTALAELSDLTALSQTTLHCGIWLKIYEALGNKGFCHISHTLWHANIPVQTLDTDAAQQVIENHLARAGGGFAHRHTDPHGGDQPHLLTVDWPIAPSAPKLAIIIPTRDQMELTQACVESLKNTLAHPEHTEIIIINNDSQKPDMLAWLNTLRQSEQQVPAINVLDHEGPFNWAEMNNRAASTSDAAYFLFLNNDTLALDYGWDKRLRGQLNRPEIGAVGARLLFEDRTIQFAGYIMHPDHIALKEEYGHSPIGGGYKNRSQLPHATSALIGAFIGCRRDTFDAVEGFDAEKFAVAFNDIDFSLRVSGQGLINLYDPGITLLHFESKSRGYDRQDQAKTKREQKERAAIQARHKTNLQIDNHYPGAFLACEPTFSLLTARQQPKAYP